MKMLLQVRRTMPGGFPRFVVLSALVLLVACAVAPTAIPTGTVTSIPRANSPTTPVSTNTSSITPTTLPSPTKASVFTPTITASSPTAETSTSLSTTALPPTSVPPTTLAPSPSLSSPPASTDTSVPQAIDTPIDITSTLLSWVVTNQAVTAMYVNSAGDIYYGSPEAVGDVSNPFGGGFALWKKTASGNRIQLTPSEFNLIGGIAVYNNYIYFDEAGALDRIPDDNAMHEQIDTVLKFPELSHIYGHINSALAVTSRNGVPILLISVGSRIDSSWDSPGHSSGIQPPYYEDFPTGRILFADLPWLEKTNNYTVEPNGNGQIYEYVKGVRNPWAMTIGIIDNQEHIFAGDNDPAFTPEKNDSNPQNAGDELNGIFYGQNYGHPYYYAGREPAGYTKPIAVFLDGSVPSGVAIADGKVFVSLFQGNMIVEVDPYNPDYLHSWTPVLTGVAAFNLASHSNTLYIASWEGIRAVDVTLFPER